MRPALKSVGLTLLMVCSTTIAFCVPANMGRSPVLAQDTPTQDRKAEANRLFEQGTKQQEQNQYEAAIASFQQALDIYRELKDRQSEGKTLKSIGIIYFNLKDYPKAIAYAQQVLNIAREIEDTDLESRALNNLGIAYQNAGNLPKGLDYLQQSLAIAQEDQNQFMVLAALQNLAQVYQDLKQPEKAIAMLQQGIALAQQTANLAKAADFLSALGDLYTNQEQYPQAIAAYQQGLAIVRKIPDKLKEAVLLGSLGGVYRKQRQYQQAIAAYQQASSLAQQVQAKRLEASILGLLGNTYSMQKQYEQAIAVYQQALVIVRALPDKAEEAFILSEMGDAYRDQNQYKQAIDVYQQALVGAQTAKARPLEADVLAAMAGVYFYQKDIEQEIDFQQKALAIRQELHDERGQLTVLINLSNAYELRAADYRRRGMNAQAQADSSQQIKLAQETISLAKKLQAPKKEAQALILLGQAYFALKDYAQAELFLQQGAELAGENQVFDDELSALANLSVIYSMQGNNRKFIEIQLQQIEIARQLKDKAREALGLITVGSAYNNIGENQKALEIYQQALAIVRQTDLTASPPILRDSALAVEFYALWGLSNAYGNLGEYDQELDFAQQANRKAQSLQRKDLEAQGWLKLARTYNDFNNFSKAAEASQQALVLAQQVKAKLPGLESDALQTLSDAYVKQGNYALAEKTAAQSLAIARQLEDSQLEKNALETLSKIYTQQGNYPKALAYTQQALAVVQRAKLQNFEFLLWTNLVQNYIAVGDTTKAMEAAQQAIAFAKQHQNPANEALALELLGLVYKARGEYEQGIETTQTAQRMFHEQRLFVGEVGTANELSQMHEAVGDYQKVISVAEPGLTRAQKIHDRDKETELTLNLGNAYRVIGNYAKAKTLLEQGLKSARELKVPRLESIALDFLGYYYVSLNDFQTGLNLTQQSYQIAQTLKSPPLMLSPQFDLGDIYNRLGEYSKSREFYQQALKTSQQLKNRQGEGLALLAQAYTYFAQSNSEKTIDLAQQALTIFQEIKVPRLEAFAHRALSIGYGELDKDAQAMASAQTFLVFARKVQNLVFEKDALTLLGDLHRKFGRNELAIVTYQQALAIPSDDQVAGADSSIYGGLAKIYADRKETGTAIAFYKQTINGIEQVRRHIEGLPPELQASFLQATDDFGHAKRSDVYRQLADLLISQGRIGEAQQVIELLKVQELNDLDPGTRASTARLAELALNPTEQEIQKRYANLIAFGQRVKDCKQDCSALKAQRQKLFEQFEAYQQSIQKTISDGTLVRIDERNKDFIASASKIVNAQPNTVLIYPLVLSDKIHLLWATQGGVLSSTTCPIGEKQLTRMAIDFQTVLQSPSDIDAVKRQGKALYDCLIKPLEEKGEWEKNNVKHLVIAPDRAINYIPIGALFDGKQFLIERYTTSNILNAGLTNIDGKLPQQPSVLGIGISEPLDNFAALPDVKQELQTIVRTPQNPQGLYQGSLYLNQASTPSAFEENLGKYPIIHLATHGEFNPSKPNQSYLLFSSGQKGKGLHYTVSQIQQQEALRNVDLVVLSACQTGKGESTSSGIEIQGMSAAFVRDRAKAVIASLWNVNDTSTSLLMQQFYQNLSTGKMTKSEALRQAQLSLLQGKLTGKDAPQRATLIVKGAPPSHRSPNGDFSHPYYWAPFILIGNGL